MQKRYWLLAALALVLLITNCSRKHAPETAAAPVAVKKPVVKKIRTATPSVIVVNDNAAKKSFDGRLYYDLEGRRYWKNYSDGKYYLFNNRMFADSAFKPH